MHILKTVQNGKNWCTRPLKPFMIFFVSDLILAKLSEESESMWHTKIIVSSIAYPFMNLHLGDSEEPFTPLYVVNKRMRLRDEISNIEGNN